MAFPAGPYTDNQLHTEAGLDYIYKTATGGWNRVVASSGTPVSRTFTGIRSLTGGGDLSADRTISLVNDTALLFSPSAYRSDVFGVRKWLPAPGIATWVTGTVPSATTILAGGLVNFALSSRAMTAGSEAGGTYITLTASTAFTIDATAFTAAGVPIQMELLNRTIPASPVLMRGFVGSTNYIHKFATTVKVGFRCVTTVDLVDPYINFSIYTI